MDAGLIAKLRRRKVDLTGRGFGWLTVLSPAAPKAGRGGQWLVRCGYCKGTFKREAVLLPKIMTCGARACRVAYRRTMISKPPKPKPPRIPWVRPKRGTREAMKPGNQKHQLAGCTFGWIHVLERAPAGKWLCRCRCGTNVLDAADRLLRGHRKSCGAGPCRRGQIRDSGYTFRADGRPRYRHTLPKGVRKKLNRYVALAWIDGRNRYLGSYLTPELAHAAYARTVSALS